MSSLAGDIPVVVCRSILEKEVLQRLLPLGPFEVSNSYCFQDGLAAALHYFGAFLACALFPGTPEKPQILWKQRVVRCHFEHSRGGHVSETLPP